MSKFSARLSETVEPIREFAKDKVPFNLGPRTSVCVYPDEERDCKHSHTSILYPKKQTVLQTGASIKGLGAHLPLDEKPVYFASKTLADVQKGYVAIELESRVVAWVMENFHHFLYASHIILQIDQKPLEAILSKSINQAKPTLQRI